jgi:hypothetical protein
LLCAYRYLQSTALEFKGQLFIQKSGICIGSQLAPFLTNIYLAPFDACADKILDSNKLVHAIYRYVDDVIVLCHPSVGLTSVLKTLASTCPELTFTEDLSDPLQFLDLRIVSSPSKPMCWAYGKSAPKALLPAQSFHSRIVKASVNESLINAAYRKSCSHFLVPALDSQVLRLQKAGYSAPSIQKSLARVIHKGFVSGQRDPSDNDKRKVTIPYTHDFSHSLMKLAHKNNLHVRLSVPIKLSCLAPFNKVSSRTVCGINHPRSCKFIECEKNCVYKIPLKCGKFYIGQTKRCVNHRLQEHSRSVKTAKQKRNPNVAQQSNNDKCDDNGSELVNHVISCKDCIPGFQNASILHRDVSDYYERVILEAKEMNSLGSRAVSQPSVNLSRLALDVLS